MAFDNNTIENSANHDHDATDGCVKEYTLSWTAYIRPVLVLLVFYLIARWLYAWKPAVGVALFVVWTVVFVLQVLSIRAVSLFIDPEGVWVQSGIFPWTKGVGGVRWRDIDEANYELGFFAWAFKSYKIRVGHRFTKASEIVMFSVHKGNLAVEYINARVGERIEAEGNSG